MKSFTQMGKAMADSPENKINSTSGVLKRKIAIFCPIKLNKQY